MILAEAMIASLREGDGPVRAESCANRYFSAADTTLYGSSFMPPRHLQAMEARLGSNLAIGAWVADVIRSMSYAGIALLMA